MKPLIIIQARTGSTRLPNKMTMPFYGGKSVLDILLERLNLARPQLEIEDIVIATTNNPKDDAIIEICNSNNIKYCRGSENDVLQRFIDTATKYNAQKIIRICADNVFLDITSLTILSSYLNTNGEHIDYISFQKSDNTPSILTHYGFFAEGVTLSALKKVKSLTDKSLYHEHVTNYIYNAQDIFNVKFFPIEEAVKGIESHTNLRLTLDTQDDFDIQRTIYSHFIEKKLEITPSNIMDYLDNENPGLYPIMSKTIKSNSK